MSRITFPNILARTGLTDKSRSSAASAAAQAVLPQLIVMTPVASLAEPEGGVAQTDAAQVGTAAVGQPVGNVEDDIAEASTTEESIPVKTKKKTKKAGKDSVKKKPKKSEAEQPLTAAADTNQLLKQRLLLYLQRHPVGVIAVILLIVATPVIVFGGTYWKTHGIKPVASQAPINRNTAPARGPNIAIPATQLNTTLQQITNQPINLVVGAKTVPIDPATIKSWLHIVTDKKTNTAYIHLNEKSIAPSINQLTSKYAKSPVNQVTITHPDGTSLVAVGGREGVNVGDPNDLAKQLAPTVLAGKGMQLNVPLQPVPFQSVTAAAFDKLIEVNVVTKQMYLYDKGNFTRQYAISAGAPVTPTPIGQFKVYAKFASQDMKGFNPDGSKYLQPHVPWINYFLPGGYAVHGNYWRPASVFGAVNTSHGCVSLPVDQAKWVYDWTPIGTTVIVHT